MLLRKDYLQNNIDAKSLLLALDSKAEPDPLDDTGFMNLEFDYTLSMAEELNFSVNRIYDKTHSHIKKLAVNFDREELFNFVNRTAKKELGVTLPKNLQPKIKEFVEKIYKFCYNQASRTISTSLSLKDTVAIEYMKSSDNFYVGKQFARYKKTVTDIIREQVFDKGLGAKQVAEKLQEELSHLVDTKFHHYENVARTSANRVRNWSRLHGFQDIGVKTVTVIAVIDERTSAVCLAMDGHIFKVEYLTGRIDEIIEAGEENLPDISPFPKVNDIVDQKGKLITANIEKLGINLPPYHGRCRTVVV